MSVPSATVPSSALVMEAEKASAVAKPTSSSTARTSTRTVAAMSNWRGSRWFGPEKAAGSAGAAGAAAAAGEAVVINNDRDEEDADAGCGNNDGVGGLSALAVAPWPRRRRTGSREKDTW